MKVSCLQSNLHQGLATVLRAVHKNNTLPALSCVLLEVVDGMLQLSATDLSLGITRQVGCQVYATGGIAIPARLLGDFVSSLSNEPVDMAVDDKTRTLMLQCGRFEAAIKGLDPMEFPAFPAIDSPEPVVRLAPATLRDALSRVTYAAATQDTRPAMTGINTEVQPGKITLVAADGFRLALHDLVLDQQPQESTAAIIPARAMDELGRILADQEDPVDVFFSANRNQVFFRCGGTLLVSNLLEARYPDYRVIIPTSWTTRAVVSTAELLKAVRIAAFFARDGANIIRLEVQPGGIESPGKMLVTASGGEVGSNVSEVDTMVEGPGGRIAFNSRYMADAILAISTSSVALEMTTPDRPGVLRPVDANGQLGVIMPMQL